MNKQVADSFEQSFLATSLADQIAGCQSYDLAPLFIDLFSTRQPVLEAGCGSGRWCGWLQAHGISADGIDWSKELCDRASRAIPTSRFFAADFGATSLPDGAYGSVLALGSVEHSVEGPQAAFQEFFRLLRSGGVAVITVPYGGALRLAMRKVGMPFHALKSSRLLRRILGKTAARSGATTLPQARRTARTEWHPRFALTADGWSFYEYEFNSAQMDAFLRTAGFTVSQRFASFKDEGILHTFGAIAGRWIAPASKVEFTLIGRILRRLIPASAVGHMLCYVVEKP